jgi:TolA-binding protein
VSDPTSNSHDQERGSELLRLWKGAGVPVDDADAIRRRRERVVPQIQRAMRRGLAERALRHRRAVWGACAVAAAIAVFGGFRLAQGLAEPAVNVASGARQSVEARVVFGELSARESGHSSVLGSGGLVDEGVTLSTNAQAGARLSIAGGGEAEAGESAGSARDSSRGRAQVDLAKSTEVSVMRLGTAERRLQLHAGRVDVEVDPTTAQRRFVVQTPEVEVVVKGTVFAVDVARDGEGTSITRVNVSRGVVEIDLAGRVVATLRAGQSWSSRAGLAQRVAADVPVAVSEKAAPSVSNAPKPAPTSANAIPSDGERPGTLAAENQLFGAAVDARNRGNDAEAAELFSRFVGRYPRSPLRQEAEVEAFRALGRQGRTQEAAAQARSYLRDHGRGFARAEARELLLTPSEKR